MLYLILNRIRNVSEQAITALYTRVQELSIRTLPGEDVDVAVSLIKTTHRALTSASTPDHSFVPDDLAKTVLRVFQISTVDAFNSVFTRELSDAQDQIDSDLKNADDAPTPNRLTGSDEENQVVENLEADRLVQFENQGVKSAAAEDVQFPKAWYTLNRLR